MSRYLLNFKSEKIEWFEFKYRIYYTHYKKSIDLREYNIYFYLQIKGISDENIERGHCGMPNKYKLKNSLNH